MVCEKLFCEINSLSEKYVKILEDVCNIESPTDFKEGVDKVGNYFAALSENLGFSVERFEQNVAGDVLCVTMNKEALSKPIALSGVMDCKGGIVAGFMAMEALKNIGFKDRPVMMLLQTDEEVGSRISNKATINYICEKAKDCVAFLNLEGYEDSYKGKATLVRKGITRFKFTIEGIEAHSSYCAVEGANAIIEAAHKMIEIDKIKDNDGITCNCGVIRGGSVANTVAGSCEFIVDVRTATNEQKEWIKNRFEEIADTVYVKGTKTKVELLSYRVAMELCDRNVKLLEKINGIFSSNGLSTLELGSRRGGSDAADVTTY